MIITIIIVSCIAHIFLCRWILKKAYQLNENESVKDIIPVCFYPFVGTLLVLGAFLVELDDYFTFKQKEYENKDTWFNGKNW